MRPDRCRVLAVLALVCVAGCAGLPPKPQPVKLATDAPLTVNGLTGDRGDWPAEKWWKHYGDPVLDQLIDRKIVECNARLQYGVKLLLTFDISL